MMTIAEPIDADALRVRHEFLTLPGLHASVDFCALLLGLQPRHALVILESLVRDGFLERTADGQYVRTVRTSQEVTRAR
jgi:predicted transcriptional regulator of viral defense system